MKKLLSLAHGLLFLCPLAVQSEGKTEELSPDLMSEEAIKYL